jgi:hypothetical protein
LTKNNVSINDNQQELEPLSILFLDDEYPTKRKTQHSEQMKSEEIKIKCFQNKL